MKHPFSKKLLIFVMVMTLFAGLLPATAKADTSENSTYRITVTWDDDSNAAGMRPDKDDFVQNYLYLWNYIGHPRQRITDLPDASYTVTEDGNTWVIDIEGLSPTATSVHNFAANVDNSMLMGINYNELSFDSAPSTDTTSGYTNIVIKYINDVQVVIEGNKVLNGKPLTDGEFEFVIQENDDRYKEFLTYGFTWPYPMPEVTTVQNKADGSFEFVINFAYSDWAAFGESGSPYSPYATGPRPDVFHYAITEVKGDKPYDYDAHTEYVSVSVIPDSETFTLNATVSYDDSKAGYINTPDDGKVEFTNTYAEGSAKIEAHKTLDGRALKDGEFEFVLKDTDGNVVKTATNDADGNVNFDLIYTLADLGFPSATETTKTFKYTVEELGKGDNLTVYDQKSYGVTVEVHYIPGNPNLEVTVTYDNGKAPEFINKAATKTTRVITQRTTTKRVVPQTGDDTNLLSLIGITGVAGMCLMSMAFLNRKHGRID